MRTSKIIQTAFVVDDLEDAMNRWLKVARIGPFYMMRNITPENLLHRGQPASLTMHIGFAQAGPTQIELIQPVSSGPNVYRDSVPAGRDGYHHVCYFTDDFDAELAHYKEIGAPVACQATYGAMRYAYFDTRESTAGMTEVMERDGPTEDMFKMIADAAVDWDGRDSIRLIG